MKALEKDRNRRYETANGLAADLRRYLDDEPVQACPPSAWYRFRQVQPAEQAGPDHDRSHSDGSRNGGGEPRLDGSRSNGAPGQYGAAGGAGSGRFPAQLERGAWPEALSSVRRAQGILTGGGTPALVQRIAQRRAELELVARLEEVRLVRPSVREEERFDDQDVAVAPTARIETIRKCGRGLRERRSGRRSVLCSGVARIRSAGD